MSKSRKSEEELILYIGIIKDSSIVASIGKKESFFEKSLLESCKEIPKRSRNYSMVIPFGFHTLTCLSFDAFASHF